MRITRAELFAVGPAPEGVHSLRELRAGREAGLPLPEIDPREVQTGHTRGRVAKRDV
jgi:hypothetical protein